jgi:hypothetical protein
MAITYQTVLDLARLPLSDSDNVRYSDADLMTYANHGILAMLKRRPDLFIGQFASLPNGEKVPGDSFPLSAQYVQLLADYVTARAETSDDEFVNSGRATLFMQLFGVEAQA